jgi:hypothetical protein
MFPILAGMVVAFIAQSYRFEEHRVRLLMAGPLTTRQLAGVTNLLPVCLVILGALAVVPMMALATLVSGNLDRSTLRVLGVLTGQFVVYAQMGPLVQEAVAARQQGRGRAALAAWTGLILAIPLLTAFYWLETRPELYVLGYLIVMALVMAASVALYQGRTDFTR